MLPKCDYYFSFKYPPHIKTMANRYILSTLFSGILSRTDVVFKTMLDSINIIIIYSFKL